MYASRVIGELAAPRGDDWHSHSDDDHEDNKRKNTRRSRSRRGHSNSW